VWGDAGRGSVSPGAACVRRIGAVLSLLPARSQAPQGCVVARAAPWLPRAESYARTNQSAAPRVMGTSVPPDAAVACSTPGDCGHCTACPRQSPDRLSRPYDAQAARAATVTTPRTTLHYTVYPICATALECRVPPGPTAPAGGRGAGAPAVTDDGGAEPSANGGGRRAPGANVARYHRRP
jgi:hypothetical protein